MEQMHMYCTDEQPDIACEDPWGQGCIHLAFRISATMQQVLSRRTRVTPPAAVMRQHSGDFQKGFCCSRCKSCQPAGALQAVQCLAGDPDLR